MRTHHLPGRAATALSLLLALLLTACGGGGGGGGNGDDNNTPQLQPPAILSFTGSPAEVLPAQAATLSWNVDNVDQVRIEPDLGLQPAQGSASVRPLTTTRYTLTAGNAAGNRSASTTVTVTVLPAPTVDAFRAQPATIGGGGSTTLEWATANALTVRIEPDLGLQAVDGSLSVSPATTTTYTLTATGAGGSRSAQTTVTVIPAPVIDRFEAAPAAMLPDESAMLSWSVREASQVSIDQGIGVVPADGSRSVSPSATTTYRLTATGPGGETIASTTLTVVVYDWTALAAALDAAVGSGDSQVPGYSFALEIAGRTVFRRGAGNLGVNTAVPIASASKAASAAAILALVDAGLIDLDEPVSTYLGDSIDWPIDKTTITMRMLLNHTSGLPFDSPCLADSSLTLQACAQEIANRTLTLPIPGSAFLYSGAGYQLAGYVAQQAAGMPWTELFEQYLGEPLGMSSFRYLGDENPRIGGGALSGTLDYLRLMRMFLDGGRANGQQVLSADSAASVTADQISPRLMFGKPVDGSLDGYSNGWWLSAEDAHPGSAGPELSDPGLFGATPWMDFDKDYSAALWVVKDTASGVALWRQLRPLILQQIEAQGLPE